MRLGEIRDVYLDVMAVIWRRRRIGLAKRQRLAFANADVRHHRLTRSAMHMAACLEDFLVEMRDRVGTTDRRIELELDDAENHHSEGRRIGLVNAEPVAP